MSAVTVIRVLRELHLFWFSKLGLSFTATLPVSRSGQTVTSVREFTSLCYPEVIAVRPFARVLTFLGLALLTCVELVSWSIWSAVLSTVIDSGDTLSAITLRYIVRQRVSLDHNTFLI